MLNVTRINVVHLVQDLPDTIHVGGRISPSTVWDYVGKLKTSLSKVGFTKRCPKDCEVLQHLITKEYISLMLLACSFFLFFLSFIFSFLVLSCFHSFFVFVLHSLSFFLWFFVSFSPSFLPFSRCLPPGALSDPVPPGHRGGRGCVCVPLLILQQQEALWRGCQQQPANQRPLSDPAECQGPTPLQAVAL